MSRKTNAISIRIDTLQNFNWSNFLGLKLIVLSQWKPLLGQINPNEITRGKENLATLFISCNFILRC